MAKAKLDEDIEDLSERVDSLDIIFPPGIMKIKSEDKYKLTSNVPGLEVDRLVIDQYLSNADNIVLFLGEGNFTFSAAVASFRRTWNNIIPSDIRLIEVLKDYNKLFRKMIVKMAGEDTTDSEFRKYVRDLVGLKEKDWRQREVDARKLNESWGSALPKPNALFFQCPWSDEVDNLIRDFFKSAKDFQINDDLLFLSICTTREFGGRYKLSAEYKGYKLLGVDDLFCKKMFARGYVHETGYTPEKLRPTSETDLLNSFVTLCYIRTGPKTATP